MPGTASFAVEGGMLVHNCKYLVLSGLDRAQQTPIARVKAKKAPYVSDYDPMAPAYAVQK